MDGGFFFESDYRKRVFIRAKDLLFSSRNQLYFFLYLEFLWTLDFSFEAIIQGVQKGTNTF